MYGYRQWQALYRNSNASNSFFSKSRSQFPSNLDTGEVPVTCVEFSVALTPAYEADRESAQERSDEHHALVMRNLTLIRKLY